MKNKKFSCIIICFFAVVFAFAQNTRKFALESGSTSTPYVPTGKLPELVVQEGHRGSIAFIKFNKTGTKLYTCADYEIKIWDVATGYLLKTINADFFHDPLGIIDPPAFSPNDDCFIYRTEKTNSLTIYDLVTGKEKTIDDNFSLSRKVAFSSDGKYFVSSNGYNVINIYEKNTLQKIMILTNNNRACSYSEIAFSMDNSFLAAIDEHSNSIDLWSVTSKSIIDTIKNVPTDYSYISNLTISKDNKYVIYFYDNKIFVYDRANRKTIYKFDLDAPVHDLKCTTDQKLFAVGHNMDIGEYHKKFIKLWDLQTGKEITSSELKTIKEDIDCIDVSPKNDFFAFGAYRKIEIHSYITGKLVQKTISTSELDSMKSSINTNSFLIKADHQFYNFNEKLEPYSFINLEHLLDLSSSLDKRNSSNSLTFRYNCDGIYVKNKRNRISFFDFDSKEMRDYFLLDNATDEIYDFATNAKSNKILYNLKNNKKKVYIHDTSFKKTLSEFAYNDDCYRFVISPKGNFALISYKNKTDVIDIKKSKSIKTLPSGSYSFSNEDEYLISNSIGNFFVYNTITWQYVVPEIKALVGYFSDSGKYYAIETYQTGNVEIYDAYTKLLISTINNNHRYISDFFFFENDKKVLILDNAGILRCYEVQTGNLLVSIVANSTGDWLTYTPEGYFTGSPGGINKFVHLVDGMQVFELGQLYDTLYRPDLVQAKLEGKDIGENPLKKIVATGDAPRVQFTQAPMATARNIKVEFSVQDTGGGIGYVYLSQNGKAMQVSSGEKSKAGQRFIYTCDVTLANGENVFEAYAANSANKIESRHVSSTLSWQGKVEDSNLYVLAIGVDKYIKMPQNNLKYSVADATGIIESFKASPGGLYGSVNVMTLLDSDVSKDNIQKAFETFASKVKPDDMFVLHLAGHGVNYGGEYYYLPSDTLAKSDSDYPKVGVSKHFLTESLSEIQSLNTIILLDTCYSGAFIDAKAQGNELAQKTALEHLAHTSGQVILTASANSQTAAEGYKGHGIFTYAIMEAISGKANYNADSTLSIKEITQYVGYEVPNIYEKMGLARQSPWNSPLRGDFSVVATGNRQSPQFHEVSLDGGKRTDWVTVRTDDSDVGNFEEALASAKKEAKKTSRSSGADQRSRGKGIYVGLGYGNTRFGSGFAISPEFYFLGWKHFYAGVGSDIIYKGAEKSESGKDIRKLDADIKFLLGYSYTFKRLRPYLCGGVGGYFSGDAKEKEIFVSSNSKTGVVTKTVYESDAKTGFVWEVAVGSDILLAEHFVIGAQYKLKNFVNCGFTDTWTVTIGWPF